MNKRIAAFIAVAAFVAAGVYLLAPVQTITNLAYERQQIVTNIPGGELPDVTVQAKTVLAMPQGYENSVLCTDLRKGFGGGSQTLLALKNATKFKAYQDGHPDFEYRWQGVGREGGVNYLPEVSKGSAVVLITDANNKPIYKATNKTSRQIASDIQKLKIFDKICPKCPKPKPEPKDEPVDEPTVIPDTDVDSPLVPVDESSLLEKVVAFVAGAFVGWLVVFRAGVARQ